MDAYDQSIPSDIRQAHLEFYNVIDPRRWGREKLDVPIPRTFLDEQGPILEVGCGNGPIDLPMATKIAADISHPALARLIGEPQRVQCDAQRLPMRSRSLAGYLSVATFEHLPCPDLALRELDRVLAPGGMVLLAPAWNCRPWTATGVTVRSYRELSFRLKLLKLSLLVRERLFWRALGAGPRRLWRELRALARRAPLPLDFKRLKPNLNEYLVSDSDAWASIDPHAAISYLRTRGYEVESHSRFVSRMLARHEPVLARKPR